MNLESEGIPIINPINNIDNSDIEIFKKYFTYLLIGIILTFIGLTYVKITSCAIFDINSKNSCYGIPESFIVLGCCITAYASVIVFYKRLKSIKKIEE